MSFSPTQNVQQESSFVIEIQWSFNTTPIPPIKIFILQSYEFFFLVINLRDEIYVYKQKRHNYAILVQGLLCLASSSIEGVSMEQRTSCSLTARMLCNVQRHFNDLNPLSDKVTNGNVVHAMFSFQEIYRKGFHAAAMLRHFCRFQFIISERR